MHVLDLFNDKDRNFLNGGTAITEGGMPALNLEYQDYLKLPPMAFQSRYKMSKEAWAEKYKNLLPKPAPVDPLSGIPDAPMEEGEVIPMPTRARTATPQSTAADVIPMIKDRSNRAYEMWKQRILRTNSDSAGKIKFYSKGNKIVAQIPPKTEPLGTFNIDTYTGTVLNEVDPNNFDSDWDYQNAVAKSGRPRSSYRSSEDDTFDADVAYSNKMYQLSQKQQRDADHDRLATGTNEGVRDLGYDAQSLIMKLRRDIEEKRLQPTRQAVLAAATELAGDMDFAPELLVQQVLGQGVSEGEERVDTLVTKGLGLMRGPKWLDAVAAIKYQVGERDYRERKEFYDFFVKQLVDRYGKKDVAEGDGAPDIQPGMKTQYGTVVSVKGNDVVVKASNGDETVVNIHDIDQAVAEVDMNRRGFLKGLGAAAVTAATGGAMAQSQPPMAGLPRVDQVDRQKMTITLDGKEYPLVILSPTDFRPRGGQLVHITCAQMGERCLGRYDALLAQNRVFILPGTKIDSTQPAPNAAPARIDSPSGPSGFSKEYLQKAADPNRTGIYMVSVEKAQQLLKQMQEGVAEGQLELNTPDPVVVVQDLKGNILDKINLSVAAQKYQLGQPENIKKQLAHQNYTKIGNYTIVSPMTGQPQDATTQGVAEGIVDTVKDKYSQFKDYFDDSPEAVQRKLARLRATNAEAQPGANSATPMAAQTGQDPYMILGIQPGANSNAIKLAYRRLAKQHHPDAGGNAAEFQKIKDAFNQLLSSGAVVREGNSVAKYKMVCKDCGDVFNKPTTNCRHDSHNSNGPNWIKKNKGVAEGGGTSGLRTWSGQVRLAHGKDVKFYNRKNDTIDRIVAMKGLKLVGIFDRATDKGRVIDEDISRRGFLKGMGAAAVAGVGGNSQAQTDQRYDLGNSFVTASATIDGVTYRAIQDTISKSGYMLNQRSDGTPIVNRPGEFLVIRNGKIEARPSLSPNIMRALQKAGILPDDGEMQSQTEPAVTHSSRGGTNQPAVTHSSRGGTNQPAVTHSSSGRQTRNEETVSRMKMDDYIKAADSLQSKLSNAIKLGDKELIQKLSKERDDLDARVRQHGLVPEASKVNQQGKQPVGEANMQSLIISYKNLIKRALGIAFGKKQNTSDPMAFQRMMSKVTAPLDSAQYSRLWQEYKNNPQYYISLPTMDEIENNKKMYFWSNSLAEFVMNKFPDASKEALLQTVEGLAQLAANEFKNKHRDLDEAAQQKPRVRKYTKMRPDGSKAVRYEVLDHMGRRITGQGPEGFDDPKLAKDFYYKNYDRLASLDEIVDNSTSDTPTKPDMKKAGKRYWCSEEKRWKDH